MNTARCKYFQVISFEVIVKSNGNFSAWNSASSATVKLRVQGEKKHVIAEGKGPIHALDNALRKALDTHYSLEDVRLTNYSVKNIEYDNAASIVSVIINFSDGQNQWQVEKFSTDVINASFLAIVEGLSRAIEEMEKGDKKTLTTY